MFAYVYTMAAMFTPGSKAAQLLLQGTLEAYTLNLCFNDLEVVIQKIFLMNQDCPLDDVSVVIL